MKVSAKDALAPCSCFGCTIIQSMAAKGNAVEEGSGKALRAMKQSR